jgi:hypothetical protein
VRLSYKGRQSHSTSTAWQETTVLRSMWCEDAGKKRLGQRPQAVIVLTELMSPAQAKREMEIVKSKHARKGKERKLP